MSTLHRTGRPVAAAISALAPGEKPRIGELMVARGLITDEQRELALQYQRTTGKMMGEILVEFGVITRFQLTQLLAWRLGYDFVDLSEQQLDPEAIKLVPEGVARRYHALPYALAHGHLSIAIAQPENVFALDDLRVLTEMPVIAVMADPDQLTEMINRVYTHSEIVTSVGEAVTDLDDETLDLIAVRGEAEDAPVVRLVQALLEQAIAERASDVHIEPLSDRATIRFRTDGVLYDASEIPPALLRPVISRIKVLSGIDIARRRVPQDGRFSLTLAGREIDVRVATLPCGNSEAAVLRLLDRGRGVFNLSELGFPDDDRERFERAFRSPQGWILVSGPTGSGKTSTMYATLLELNSRDRSIVSIEDPIEYRLDGVKQMQINNRAGMGFSTALRSVLRADPDVILVGEIRDKETAAIAADASVTGHLVLSSIHTIRASAVPIRLIDMGVEPYLVGAALSCVIGQRLVRRLCEKCAAPDEPKVDLLHRLGCSDEAIASGTFRRAVGCGSCGNTGYKGRSAVYEILTVSEQISRLILHGASSHDIEATAIEQGMLSLSNAAAARVLAGEITTDELLRVFSVY